MPLKLPFALLFSAAMATACDSGTPAAPDADPGPDTTGEKFTVTIGPITVPAGHEDTMCVEKRLGNLDHAWIGKLHTELRGVSHHLIVYRVASTEERPEPFPCFPFVDTLNPEKGTPLMVSQVQKETLDLPFGVALGVDANQMVRVEMHFVNPTDAEATVEGEAVFEVLPDAQFQHEAGFLFIGNPDIEIPPGAEHTLGPVFFPLPPELADVSIFAVTGHQHHWGTNVRIEHRTTRNGPGTPIYDYPDWSWSEPPVAKFQPALEMPAGSGFEFTCTWKNGSAETVGFGESANDEMCFFWAYYYPTQGHKVCAHSEQLGVPIDLCCPKDDPLCDLFIDEFGGGQ